MLKLDKSIRKSMTPEELKIARKRKGLTQKEVADLIVVSFQTYNGYENGKKIPTTKYQILENVLYSFNQVNEPSAIYFTENGHDKTIKHLNELIVQREEILKILNPNSLDYYHNLEMIQMYKDRIKYINVAKQEGRK
ncbi:helix-turn-helix transcriptional regulator [Flavobacterium columnare]|uniref:helix-turn-helix domain-containing protein n=1 Tax=Flavobacterium columnare TaxID=996 RepID=UPI002D2093C9|nr:helix-turn-helix transcriptional regulator [Flavobacterium columnare]MEB3800629.1 helix-turn-helix transcriptional regulator [Flavobacterium columnare]